MTAFDRIRALLEPRCPHLGSTELDRLTRDVLLAVSQIESPDPYRGPTVLWPHGNGPKGINE